MAAKFVSWCSGFLDGGNCSEIPEGSGNEEDGQLGITFSWTEVGNGANEFEYKIKKNKSVELMVFSASGFSSLCLLVCVFTKALNEAWQL